MRTVTIRKDVYTFDELSETAKEKALSDYRIHQLDYDWHEFVVEDAKEIGRILGIDVKNIWFSGFSSQGDGACFEGSYSYAAGAAKKIREHAPLDTELHQLADNLQHLQAGAFFSLHATVKHRGHYYHENCTEISVENSHQSLTDDQESGIKEFLRDFMRWIYKRLEEEYDYLTSDETISEYFRESEIEFTENGEWFD